MKDDTGGSVNNGKGQAPGRESNGRFAKGNNVSLGGVRKTAAPKLLKDAILRRMSSEKLDKIIDKLVTMAVGGDKDAARLLFEHCYGKPLQRTELTGAEGAAVTFEAAVTALQEAEQQLKGKEASE